MVAMLIIVLVFRLLLSLIFGIAGVAKLLDQRGTREAVTNFGAPASWSATLALLLPLAEIATAVGLLVSLVAWGSAQIALLLLGLFIAAIAVNLGRGRAPECHCFGQLYSRPLGWPTLLRNVLFAIGTGVVIRAGPQVIKTSGLVLSEKFGVGQSFPLLAFLANAIVNAVVVYFQKRAKANAALSPSPAASQGLPLEAVAPAFALPAYRRDRTSLADLLEPGMPLLLIFSNPRCGPCAALFGELAEWQRAHRETVTIAVVTQGTLKDNFVNIARNDLQNVLFQTEREVAEQYQAVATPTGVLVSRDGLIDSNPAAGADEIRKLIHSLAGAGRNLKTCEPQIQNTYLAQPSTQGAIEG